MLFGCQVLLVTKTCTCVRACWPLVTGVTVWLCVEGSVMNMMDLTEASFVSAICPQHTNKVYRVKPTHINLPYGQPKPKQKLFIRKKCGE